MDFTLVKPCWWKKHWAFWPSLAWNLNLGSNSFLLRGVPASLAECGGNWKEEILEIASSAKKTTAQKEQALITLACKGAVKAGQYLDEREIRALLDGLAETENPFTCPHGRPIIIRLENQELLRRFGRI